MRQFIVIGLGRFGTSVATNLAEMGHDVLAMDINEERVQNVRDVVTHVVEADSTDEGTLQTLGVSNFDVGVVSIGKDIQANILTTLLLKELEVPYVVAKAQNQLHGKVLNKVGADKVVYPERDMGSRVAYNLVSVNVLDYIELAPNYSIEEIIVNNWLADKTLRELNLRTKYGINVLAIKRGEELNISPGANDRLFEGDVLVVMGSNQDLKRVEEER